MVQRVAQPFDKLLESLAFLNWSVDQLAPGPLLPICFVSTPSALFGDPKYTEHFLHDLSLILQTIITEMHGHEAFILAECLGELDDPATVGPLQPHARKI